MLVKPHADLLRPECSFQGDVIHTIDILIEAEVPVVAPLYQYGSQPIPTRGKNIDADKDTSLDTVGEKPKVSKLQNRQDGCASQKSFFETLEVPH